MYLCDERSLTAVLVTATTGIEEGIEKIFKVCMNSLGLSRLAAILDIVLSPQSIHPHTLLILKIDVAFLAIFLGPSSVRLNSGAFSGKANAISTDVKK